MYFDVIHKTLISLCIYDVFCGDFVLFVIQLALCNSPVEYILCWIRVKHIKYIQKYH